MQDWIDITKESWEGTLSPEELAIISAETLDRELRKMAAEIRSMITTWSPNTVSADPLKIPPGFEGRALILVRDRVLTSIPDYTQDDDRRKQTENAEKWLALVATGKIRPNPAPDAIPNDVPSAVPSGVQIVSGPGSRTGRGRMNGI